MKRRALGWTAAALAAGVVLAAGVAAALGAAVDSGYFRAELLRFASSHLERSLAVEGSMQLHVLSFHPRLTAEGVVIGNPPWVAAGTTARIGRLSLVLEWPGIWRPFAIDDLVLEGATLSLQRDAQGRANWQWRAPAAPPGKGLPLVRRLSAPGAHVALNDDLRHLQFEGTVTAQDARPTAGTPGFGIKGDGQLNGRAVEFDLQGDPLTTAGRERPYHFAFEERSSGSQLNGTGTVSRPFDFNFLDAEFDARGEDLKDLYFLTGVTLVNTGRYHLSGRIARRDSATEFAGLEATSGQSDVHGTVSVDSAGGRPRLSIDLRSDLLRSADLGLRAAGRQPAGPHFVLADAALHPTSLRRDDALVKFRARRFELGRLPLDDVAGVLSIDHGVLTVAPLSAHVFAGALAAHARMDARLDEPAVSVDLKVADVHLEQIPGAETRQPLLDGRLSVRAQFKGRGTSLHAVASTADGTLTAAIPHGAIRAALANLAGLDLRALGLALASNAEETDLRCAVASFRADGGVLNAQRLVVDTDPMLITGTGSINLQSETLNLNFRGNAKKTHLLKLHSPILLRGSFAHPTVGIQKGEAVAEAAVAVALGVIATPLAAILAFVDPGLAKDSDCAALLAAAPAG